MTHHESTDGCFLPPLPPPSSEGVGRSRPSASSRVGGLKRLPPAVNAMLMQTNAALQLLILMTSSLVQQATLVSADGIRWGGLAMATTMDVAADTANNALYDPRALHLPRGPIRCTERNHAVNLVAMLAMQRLGCFGPRVCRPGVRGRPRFSPKPPPAFVAFCDVKHDLMHVNIIWRKKEKNLGKCTSYDQLRVR